MAVPAVGGEDTAHGGPPWLVGTILMHPYFQSLFNYRYMNCLFIAATIAEIKPFINYCRINNEKIPANFEIDFLITGVGMLQTTYSLTRHFYIKKPDLVIQAGVAGCFDKKQELTKTWIVKKDLMADLGVDEKEGYSDVFDLKLIKPNNPPFSKKWLFNPYHHLIDSFQIPSVSAISVNEITTSKKRIAVLKVKYDPLLESMEGAALHYTCLKENIPFIQIRSTSNYIGERNKLKWKLKEALKNLNLELIQFVELNS